MLEESANLREDASPTACTSWFGARAGKRWIAQVMVWLIIAAVSATAMLEGLRVRQWMWDFAKPIRFEADVANGFHWGLSVVKLGQDLRSPDKSGPLTWREFFAGYFAFYDHAMGEFRQGGQQLDYAPLRMLIMSIWARSVVEKQPGVTRWRDDLTPPVLWVNTACEMASAVGAFLLVRLWVRRSRREDLAARAKYATLSDPAIDPGHRGWMCGLIAALALWFNPAVILDAHGWPQWDVWCLPFFFWAALCCSLNWWFAGGLLLIAGAMLKGQLLLVAPLFLVWPIIQGRTSAAVRVILGLVSGAVWLSAPWLAQNKTAWIWIGCVGIAAALAYPWRATRRNDATGRWLRWAARAGVLLLVVWPWLDREWIHTAYVGVLLAGVIVVVPLLLGRPLLGYWYTALFCASLCVASSLFQGSLAWLKLGFVLPTNHYRAMSMGGSVNLPFLMEARFRWKLDDVMWAPSSSWLRWMGPFTAQIGLRWVYTALLLACTIGAARHDRRKDVRFLLAIAAPWILFFAVLPQMHERYLLWAAAITAVGAGVSIGMTLLHLLVSAIATVQILHSMLPRNQEYLPQTWQLVRTLSPEWGWLVLLVGAIYLYSSLVRTPRLVRIPAGSRYLHPVDSPKVPELKPLSAQTTDKSVKMVLPSASFAGTPGNN